MANQPAEQTDIDANGYVPHGEDATPASGSSLLRIGIVRHGRLLQEHIIAPPAVVRLGTAPGCLLAPSGSDLPDAFVLFDCCDGQYQLNLSASTAGHVALGSVTHGLSELVMRANREGSDPLPMRLGAGAQGRVVYGDASILFRVENASVRQARFALPRARRCGISHDAQLTSTIAAFSFLLHFLAVGWLFSDWQDPFVDEEAELAHLVEMVQNLPPAPPLEELPEPQQQRMGIERLVSELRELGLLDYQSEQSNDAARDARLRSILAEPTRPVSQLPPTAPKGIATVDTPKLEGGTVANVARVVAGMRAGFRNCYNRTLAGYPDAAGVIRLRLQIDQVGNVTKVDTFFFNQKLSLAAECIKIRASAAQFDPPDGGKATVEFSVKLERP